MAGSFSDYLELKLLDLVFGGVAFTAPATLYARLVTTTPSDAAAGTEVSTGTWTNYAPASITNNATNFPAAVAGSKANGTAISFGTAAVTPTNTAVPIAGVELWDAASNGNRIAWATVTGISVANGIPVSIAIGAITITLD